MLLFAALPAAAQSPQWDTSGNNLLTGTYYFREVFYIIADNFGDLGRALALYGTVSFDGAGKYTMAATLLDSNAASLQSGTLTGTYSIAASGYGFLSNPLSTGDRIFGLVAQNKIFVGSSTEAASNTGFNDLFVAAPVASPAATAATFKGSYWIAAMDPVGVAQGQPVGALDSLFQLNPDGAGNLGNVSVTGFVGAYGTTQVNQNASNVKYTFSNGAGNITFPNASNSTTLIWGQKFLYISPDGNFVFGGSPTSWDFFVGVRTASAAPNLSGQYYQAGIDQTINNGNGDLDTYYGALSAGGGSIVAHQRFSDVFLSGAVDFTYSDTYSVKSDGTYTANGVRYVVGANGARVGSGIGPALALNVALPAPVLSGDGVFLNPAGIVNAGSSAPFTDDIAPGELLTLYGTNLANTTVVASTVPYPTTLGNIQVMINNVAAPIYVVSPGQVSAWVPYGVTGSIAQIQVINSGVASNTATMWVGTTAPGIFTIPSGGLGYGAVLHADYSLVTTSHPAVAGETVLIFLTGLGAVTPAVGDGALAPTTTLSNTAATITADIGGTTAAVSFAGLAPGLAGLYQMNITVPSGLTAGDHLLNIGGPGSYTTEALIPIGGN
jgi:uncharacterized protein (TIGR03437 family)